LRGVTQPVCTLDLARLRRNRITKLHAAMDAAGVGTLVLCGQANVSYATGARVPAADHMRAAWWRNVVLLRRDEWWPDLYTEFPHGAPPELPVSHIHDAIEVETSEGAQQLSALLRAGERIAVDDAPFPLWRELASREVVDAGMVLGPAKLTKTLDEQECIRQAQAINERAMREVRALARPGTSPTEVSGAFLRAIAELGATANTVDPVFQAMPPSIAAGPYSVTGEPVFPLPTRAEELRVGDVVWVDTGLNLHGYASDFGATWIIGRAANAVERSQHERWRMVVDRVLAVVAPGATGADLVRAAGLDNEARPWLSYFYLAHGCGTDSAEPPFVGTDLGDDFDQALVLEPGMILVLEPVIWDDGHAGHRSEEIVAVTDDGYRRLSDAATLDGSSA
jgi:Xaa-Pro aminopeptidase